MLIVETIAKIRRPVREHRGIREISRELRLSHKVVRKALRSNRASRAALNSDPFLSASVPASSYSDFRRLPVSSDP